MRGRNLSAEEIAIWARVARTARPLPGREVASVPDDALSAQRRGPARARPAPVPAPLSAVARPVVRAAQAAQDTLDGNWDRRLQKGDLRPDVSIDLHGETLASAHARLNRGLEAAIRHGNRVILLVTGKPAVENPRLPPTSRGVIRASVTDWLAASPFADRIAAIRNAHPRHGGAGALYIILRKAR